MRAGALMTLVETNSVQTKKLRAATEDFWNSQEKISRGTRQR
jgi:hypothetical protein